MADLQLNCYINGTRKEAEATGPDRIQQLLERLRPALDQVKASYEKQFARRYVQWDGLDYDPQGVDYEESIDPGVWRAIYDVSVVVRCADGHPVDRFEFNEYDRWHEMGEPTHIYVYEPLQLADWSLVQSLSNETESVEVLLHAIQAVDSYSGDGHHFYNERFPLE